MDKAAQRLSGAVGGHRGWANTTDRQARMSHVQASSPVGWDWHARKRFGCDYAELTEKQQQQVDSDRKAYFAENRRRSVESARAKKADRLRAKAAKMQAEADALDGGGAP